MVLPGTLYVTSPGHSTTARDQDPGSAPHGASGLLGAQLRFCTMGGIGHPQEEAVGVRGVGGLSWRRRCPQGDLGKAKASI